MTGRPARAGSEMWMRGMSFAAALAAPIALCGCAIEWQNRQAAEELAARAAPAGSVYTGWRVFQDRCAACHGPAGTGTARGPDLLPTIREMGPHRFVSVVLTRYDWDLPAATKAAGPAHDALVDDVVQRRTTALPMPAWQGEPRVDAHIVDLYAYLAARAEGTQGPGRPTP